MPTMLASRRGSVLGRGGEAQVVELQPQLLELLLRVPASADADLNARGLEVELHDRALVSVVLRCALEAVDPHLRPQLQPARQRLLHKLDLFLGDGRAAAAAVATVAAAVAAVAVADVANVAAAPAAAAAAAAAVVGASSEEVLEGEEGSAARVVLGVGPALLGGRNAQPHHLHIPLHKVQHLAVAVVRRQLQHVFAGPLCLLAAEKLRRVLVLVIVRVSSNAALGHALEARGLEHQRPRRLRPQLSFGELEARVRAGRLEGRRGLVQLVHQQRRSAAQRRERRKRLEHHTVRRAQVLSALLDQLLDVGGLRQPTPFERACLDVTRVVQFAPPFVHALLELQRRLHSGCRKRPTRGACPHVCLSVEQSIL
eukprot:1975369-Rhodomonas_salina.2